jgi:ornithine lipid hydroxylase
VSELEEHSNIKLRSLLCRGAWPALLLSSMTILWLGFAAGHETLFFNISYAWIVLCLLVAEKRIPYRTAWRKSDGQLGADLSHTILNKGLVQLLIVSLLGLGVVGTAEGGIIAAWPLAVQVIFGLVASEFALYWAHRIAHEWPWLWHFHAVHHSVKKLWLVNTGRFHFVDSFASVFASAPILLLSGMSMDAVVWVSAITAYIGILTHCNVDMRCGPLSYVFNTPQLHRWHHAIDTQIGNNNYGENVMLWDHIFGSFFLRPEQHVEQIGIADRMPVRFLDQLTMPFNWQRYQEATSASSSDA